MNRLFVLPLLPLAASCATSDFAPLEGMPVAFGESVPVGSLAAAPVSLIEDSRCPHNVQCVWAGRVVVSTRIVGPGWSETAPLTLGEPYSTHGMTITLVSARLEKYSERRRPRSEYRFIYEGGV